MKKITYIIIAIIFLTFINACAGYKPIYTTNLEFKIEDHSIKSNNKLGSQIYNKFPCRFGRKLTRQASGSFRSQQQGDETIEAE